jgi:hypothetical protein
MLKYQYVVLIDQAQPESLLQLALFKPLVRRALTLASKNRQTSAKKQGGPIGDYISHDTDCFFTYSLKAALASEGLLISSPVGLQD